MWQPTIQQGHEAFKTALPHKAQAPCFKTKPLDLECLKKKKKRTEAITEGHYILNMKILSWNPEHIQLTT